jgi:hypothetical protein
LPKPSEPLQCSKRLLGIVSNIKGTDGKEGKENAKFGRMEEALARTKIDNNYTPSVLLSRRLLAQHFSSLVM